MRLGALSEPTGRGCRDGSAVFFLEHHPQPKLQLPRPDSRVGDLSELRRIDVLRKDGEGRVIEHIQRFKTQFGPYTLGEFGRLAKGRIHRENPGAGEHSFL